MWDEAIPAFDKAIELDPQYASAWKSKGYALEMLGRITEAEAAYAKAKELGYTEWLPACKTLWEYAITLFNGKAYG